MDKIQRLINNKYNLRIYTAQTLNTVQEICAVHDTTPNASLALGRSITAASLLAATLKPESNQNLTFRIQGSGPLKEIFVQSDAKGNIRGLTANPAIDLNSKTTKLSFSDTIGAGVLSVAKDIGMKEPYTGVSPLINGEIAADTAYYLTSSEQVPSAVIIALEFDQQGSISASGGILIQTFPDTPEESISELEKNIKILSPSLGNRLLDGQSFQETLNFLLPDSESELLSEISLQHKCRCSHDVLKHALSTVSVDDLKLMRDEDHGAETECTFCRKKYHFSEEEIDDIIKEKSLIN